ncbi:MAG: hypothetical protein ACI9QQ_002130 [Myxococcota bacterium]
MDGPLSILHLTTSAAQSHHSLASPETYAPGERSPFVAVTVAMAFAGCLVATADVRVASELPWTLIFLILAIQAEVRTFRIPKAFALAALAARLGYLLATADPSTVWLSIAGAIVAPALLFPLYGVGLIRLGTLYAGAALGAIVGIEVIPTVLLLAALAGVPFALLRFHYGANPATLPIFTIVAFAVAAFPLL